MGAATRTASRRNGQGQQSQNGQADQGRQQGGQEQRDDSSVEDDEQGEGRRVGAAATATQRGRGGHGDDADPEVLSDDVLLPIAGILDVLDNYAFVRTSGHLPGPNDVYVSPPRSRSTARARATRSSAPSASAPREGEQQHGRQKYNAIVQFDTINGQSPDERC